MYTLSWCIRFWLSEIFENKIRNEFNPIFNLINLIQ